MTTEPNVCDACGQRARLLHTTADGDICSACFAEEGDDDGPTA